uniref:NADH-ubiquinone oxidoreductase chain 6 n=1 Tax=Aphelasterias japonica TaxID=194597 RepID=A0A0A0VDE6_9ECHI|nr:NADH dehydrogenase subunit 6 [Aphelasterias japonica]AIW65068.1 NADH dehydrogenase subunit 6 [Aphelasterias japonica]
MIFYLTFIFMLLGSTLVFYSLSPYYGALGLVIVAMAGCVLCSLVGLSFMALVLLLIYVGGMLVVFVYSSALSAERYPVVSNIKEVLVLFFILVLWISLNFDLLINFPELSWNSHNNLDLIGSSVLYSNVWWYLGVGGYILFVGLVVALVITYGSEYNVLKAL